MKKGLPKVENFQIWKHQSPLSIAQCFSFEMLKNFIYKIWINQIENGENDKNNEKSVTRRWQF